MVEVDCAGYLTGGPYQERLGSRVSGLGPSYYRVLMMHASYRYDANNGHPTTPNVLGQEASQASRHASFFDKHYEPGQPSSLRLAYPWP